jgi:hypothetical protein
VVELVATHRMLEVSDESGPVINELVRGCGSSLEIWTSGMPVALGTFDGYEPETRDAALVPELMMQFAEMRTENGGLPLHDLGYAN